MMAAKGFLQLALWQAGQFRTRVINVHGHPAYPSPSRQLKRSGELGQMCRCRRAPYLNKILEQDHCFVKKPIMASQWFRSVDRALNTIAGCEAMNILRMGQIRWLARNDVVGQNRVIERTFGIAA
jgi:transposase-like protein